ncbi:sugar transferase [Chitinophaga sp. MM2321]|uniref:sugar transferase n=1 Tax=Chitinophaga sp. MM2321 TaxID=3137178 RepID=UPI0032D5771F
MNTITPTFEHVISGSETNAGKNLRGIVRQLPLEKFVLFVGQFYQGVPECQEHLKCLMVESVGDAEKLITEMLNVYRKIPAVIVFQFNSNYETTFAQWEKYFSTHQALKTIPFFLFTDKVSDSLRAFTKKQAYIDDIVTKENFNNLGSKIEFVSKFKRMNPYAAKLPVITKITPWYSHKWWSVAAKRLFDIMAASTALLLLSPVMLIIAALIKLESKGNIFYSSPRAGKNYRVFKFYKFRTMVANADKQLDQLKHLNQYDGDEKGAVFYKVSNDPRVTRLGSFLRNSSLDEIPQLFNVLKGDMSLVGNRPLPLYEAAALTTDEWTERFLAPAGITGLWQISKRGKKEMSAAERIHLDIDYAHRNSFRYDMWLMMNTPRALIQKDNV